METLDHKPLVESVPASVPTPIASKLDDKKEWMERWKKRLHETHVLARDAFMKQLDDLRTLSETDRPPRVLDPHAPLEPELICEAIEQAPMPYVLNVGCGYAPTSIGQRTKAGGDVFVVGVDPKAYEMGDALLLMATQFPRIGSARRFVLPIVAEEMGMAVPPGAFHAVWSDNTLLDCVDPVRFVQQCVRATKQGGVACIKFNPNDPSTLWKVLGHHGSQITLSSARGDVTLKEVRGERIEVHTLLGDHLMLKIRQRVHTAEDATRALKKTGIILAGGK
jgi:SAM-dependent methyltransferase